RPACARHAGLRSRRGGGLAARGGRRRVRAGADRRGPGGGAAEGLWAAVRAASVDRLIGAPIDQVTSNQPASPAPSRPIAWVSIAHLPGLPARKAMRSVARG